MSNLNDLRDAALRTAVEHGFKDASVGEDIALMHSELSEALEDYRAGAIPNVMTYDTTKATQACPRGKPCGIPSEMADVIIRILHFAGKHKIDLDKAVSEKMAFNELRPFKHGGKVL